MIILVLCNHDLLKCRKGTGAGKKYRAASGYAEETVDRNNRDGGADTGTEMRAKASGGAGEAIWTRAETSGKPRERDRRGGMVGRAAGGRDDFESAIADAGATGERLSHRGDAIYGRGTFIRWETLVTDVEGVVETGGGHKATVMGNLKG